VSRSEDDLDGWDDLDPEYRWAVSRYRARAGLYQRDRVPLTNAERWATIVRSELEDESDQIWRGGNR
jgi:hypothetical protein